ncbi:hypothetical protein CFC21_055911 [Triticum aestivum]|uniref:Uncharacterized protein n=3 Tax=Triticum TaxID=4564 RepID=A0A9R0SS76_TRITD|nr:uncharacterized protein LOC100682503 [Triticum aestivum]KAF7046921.1 hypothetical protein CFC21_055911 [Triticum aestivum]VAI00573.1 unnamed protein product [Triticum turgidum subsp. durum]
MADGGGSDWEVVSLTASTYAASPGPIPISAPIHDAADKTESPLLLLPNPPAPPAHFFMSQHFNLPLFTTTHLENNNGSQDLESGPAAAVPDGDDADHLNTPRPENRDGGRDDVPGNGPHLQVEGGGGGEELQQTTMFCSLPKDATAGADAAADATDATAVGSATLPAPAPAPAATVTVAAPSGGVGACNCNAAQAQAWWEKTFSFPRQDGSGNGTQPLAFRFVFVAGKLQLQEEDHLSVSPVPEFGQTQKISCTVTEPLDQAKVSMLGGGGPVAQQG